MPDSGTNALDALNKALNALNELQVAIGLVSEHLASVQRQVKSWNWSLKFNRSGEFLGVSQQDKPDQIKFPATSDFCLHLASDCEWLPKYVESLWQAQPATDRALSELPPVVVERLNALTGKPWLAMVRRNCLDKILAWPGELHHQTSYASEKVHGSIPDLLKKAEKSEPYATWKSYEALILEYKHDLFAVRDVVVPRQSTSHEESRQMSNTNPKVFISYSWDDAAHKQWVKTLATRLRTHDGVDVTLDQWEAEPGDRLPRFMEKAVRENGYVLIICTPNYKKKSDERSGGVGYEGDIMTSEAFTTRNHRKFIPVLRRGTFGDAFPTWLGSAYGINLNGDPYDEEQYADLIATLFKRREKAPPVRKSESASTQSPPSEATEPLAKSTTNSDAEFEPMRITGVIIDEIGEPRNDGTRGSALYEVPFKLSRRPSSDWAEAFIRNWDHPPQYTTQHRPGTAEIRGDRVILTRTTVEEVRDVHRETLKLVAQVTNEQVADLVAKRRAAEAAEQERRRAGREQVRKIAGEIDFS